MHANRLPPGVHQLAVFSAAICCHRGFLDLRIDVGPDLYFGKRRICLHNYFCSSAVVTINQGKHLMKILFNVVLILSFLFEA